MKLFLQTSGDWSGKFSGRELGLLDNTIILYEHEASARNLEGPEFVNFEDHYLRIKKVVEERVPENFKGPCIIDYESYPMTLYSPYYSHEEFCLKRINEELKIDPTISKEEAERRAQKKYEPYLKRYFLSALRIAKRLRPKAKWGFYSRISGDRNRPTDDYFRWKNDQISWLWEESDLITRSIYPVWHESEENWPRVRDLMTDKILEAVRLANNVKREDKPKVGVYACCRVMGSVSSMKGGWLTQNQIIDQLNSSQKANVDGVIFWENVKKDRPPNPTEEEYIEFLKNVFSIR